MSTQNILSNQDVLNRYELKVIDLGTRFLLKERFDLGSFDMDKMDVVIRLRNMICNNECSRIPLRATAQELLNKLLMSVKLIPVFPKAMLLALLE